MPRRALSGGLVHTPMLEGLPNLITEPWRRQFSDAVSDSNVIPTVTRVTVSARNSAILTTPIPSPPLNAGLYRVSSYLRIVTPAAVASSATPSVIFTDNAVVVTLPGTAVTGNTTASAGTNTWLVRIQAGAPISYAVAYASNGAGEMEFDLELTLEQIG